MQDQAIRDFVASVADSTVKLELLSFLVDHPFALDNCTGLAKWLNLDEKTVEAALIALAEHGIVAGSGKGAGRVWSFGEDSPLSGAARQAVEAWRLTRDSLRREVLELERSRDELNERYEAILQAERGRTGTILNSLEEAVLVTGRDGAVLSVNGALLKRFGLPGATMPREGSPLEQVLPDEPVRKAVSASLAGLENGAEADLSHDSRFYRLRSVPVTGPDGAVLTAGGGGWLAAVTVFRDVTRDREIERMREDFISMLTHDLINPLGIIYGSTTLIAGGKVGDVTDKQKRLLGNVVKSCGTMERLIQDFLAVSRLEAGKLNLNPERLDVNRLVRDVLQLFSEQLQEKSLSVTFRAEYEPGVILADPVQLERVITNLLGNAVKYNNDGGRIVIVTAAEPEARLSLEVSDNGPGIPEADLPFIFDKFRRSSAGTRAKGSGLGLAVVRDLVGAMGGEITASSAPGEGAAFRLSIPTGV